jgi:hypothetical protein
MLQRRKLFQFADVAALAGVGGAAWMYYGSRHSTSMAAEPFRPYPFDPVAPENFQQKLFIPVANGPFGVLDVAGPLKMRASAASFPLLPAKESPFLLYQTEYAGKSLGELLRQHIDAPVPRLPAEHAKFQPFLDRMMHKIPEERPANCTAVWRNLEILARD